MTALLKMKNEIDYQIERGIERGAVSIEYLAIALVVVAVLGIALTAVSGAGGPLKEKFETAIENIFSATAK